MDTFVLVQFDRSDDSRLRLCGVFDDIEEARKAMRKEVLDEIEMSEPEIGHAPEGHCGDWFAFINELRIEWVILNSLYSPACDLMY